MGTTAWPLVGRSADLAAARDALAGRDTGVVIGGPIGVGRSRLAAELLTGLEADGTTVVRLVATQAAATLPLGAAAPLLGAPRDGEHGTDHTRATDGDAAEDRDLLVTARRSVAALAADGPVVVGVDDAHLLDEATASLLDELAADGQVRLVVTVRTGDTVPARVRALWERPGWTRRELAELSVDDLGALLAPALGGEVESATVDRLWEATHGNALFLRELCREALETGALTRHHGVWTLDALPVTGPRLHDLVTGRIGQLTGDERRLAGLLALGEPVPLGVVASLAPAGALDALAARDLATVETVDGRPLARLAHPLYAEAIRARLGPLELADLYAMLVGATLAEAERPGGHPLDVDERLRLAVWSISSHTELDPALLAAAARDARRRGEPALAERLARAALGQRPSTGVALAPPTVPPPCPISFTAALTLGEALSDLHRPAEAEAVLAPLAVLATEDRQRARVALARLAAAAKLHPDDVDHARRVAATTGIHDRSAGDAVRAGLAGTLSHAGALDEAGALAVGLLTAPDETVRLRALPTATTWLLHRGRATEAVRLARDLQHAAADLEDDVLLARGWTTTASVLGLVAAGRADEADAAVATAIGDRAGRRHHDGGTLALLRGRAALARGRPVTARRALGEAVLTLERADPLGRHAWALALLAEARALLGDGDGARAALDARPTHGQSRRYQRDTERAELWVACAAGDVTGAMRRAIERADEARDAGHPGFELLFLEVALRLGAHGVATRIAHVAPTVDGPRSEILAETAAALSAGDGGRLDAAAERVADLGLTLHAAELRAQAARAHGRAGRADRAQASTERSLLLRARCEGASTPALPNGPALDDLTRREREVVLLAARGLASRAIAERLEISVRTVDNQLSRSYRKLGITGRAELPTALAPL